MSQTIRWDSTRAARCSCNTRARLRSIVLGLQLHRAAGESWGGGSTTHHSIPVCFSGGGILCHHPLAPQHDAYAGAAAAVVSVHPLRRSHAGMVVVGAYTSTPLADGRFTVCYKGIGVYQSCTRLREQSTYVGIQSSPWVGKKLNTALLVGTAVSDIKKGTNIYCSGSLQ